MKPKTKEFNKAAKTAINDPQIQERLKSVYHKFHHARDIAAKATTNWDELRNKAKDIKTHTINNLDYYLQLLDQNVAKAGGNVFFAKDSNAAVRYVLDLAHSKKVKLAIKSKSMVSEELNLNHHLSKAGIEPVETDLGEYIIQLAEETPFHIIAPAIHKSKEQVSKLFEQKLGTSPSNNPSDLAMEARNQLRDKFIKADMGITGANFMVAETGSIILVTNEGNGRMCTSMPKIHVAITGMEKIIPSIEDLGIFLRLLIRSATGQKLTSYVTTVTGPRQQNDEDGPEEFHLIVVDNGRSRLLADPELRESLNCLRCGACLNACPVYRKVGGHAYGWVYPGPIGAVVSPIMTGLSDGKNLPYASSLCGACREVCPVKINIPKMLLHLRKELVQGNSYPKEQNVSIIEKLMMKMWLITTSSSTTFTLVTRILSYLQRLSTNKDWLIWMPPPLTGWTKYRHFPRISTKPFRSRWRDIMKNQ